MLQELQILMSMMNYYNDNFDFKYDITQQVESNEIKYVKLIPKKNEDVYATLGDNRCCCRTIFCNE